MGKKLIKYTTIPVHLYVNRNADNQLKNIIEEMQRPGYVLVARQMGKTNLLFNAKRRLENDSRLFVYIDLSNVFRKERECYRNLIDNIIEPNVQLFKDIQEKIKVLREEKQPPHNEYFRSLRIILEFFKGEIVIILDEIDALRSVEYSDNIFAQIRSNYFSRTNFPVFERLTYILSGVIDPAELIRDKNKSPFNIGEKIYLDDFTFDEHNTFLENSELNLTQDISGEIFRWTNGNPRLTFDICSSIETLIIENIEVTSDSIKGIIKEKYLTTFDIAPIDHIRELVKSDKKVRNAILSIYNKKNENLNDEIKKKLYLYGIINSKFDEVTKIKNPIIELSISEEWIKSIEKQTQDNYSYGLEKIDQEEFDEAIYALTEFLLNSTPTKQQADICNYNIGFANYKLRKLGNAIEYFSKEYSFDLYKSNSKSLLGICKISIGQIDEGMIILEEVIINKTFDFAFRNAIINLAPYIVDKDKVRALDLYDELLDSTLENSDDTSEDELNKLRTLAHYYKAEIFFVDKDLEKTINSLDLALKYATPLYSLNLKYSKYNISNYKDENLKYEIIDSILELNLKFDKESLYPISFNESHLYLYLELSFDASNLSRFESLLEYAYEYLFEKKIDKLQIVYNCCEGSDKNRDLLKYILSSNGTISRKLLLCVYRDISFAYSEKNTEFFHYFNEYIELIINSDEIIGNDIYLFALAIKKYSDSNRLNDGLNLCEAIEGLINGLEDEELKFESVIIFYWYSNLSFSLKHRDKAIEYADKTIKLINDSKKERTSMIDEKGLKVIIEQVSQIKSSSTIKIPIISNKNYGRNEKVKVQYLDGKILDGKYKKFEADLLAERCKLINVT